MILNEELKGYKLILASGSPRRKELMEAMGLDFRIADKFECEEICPDYLNTYMTAGFLSQIKSRAYVSELADNEILITADTVVMMGEKVLGKPKDRTEAIAMLNALSGKDHMVVSGVTLRNSKKQFTFTQSTFVRFKLLNESEIEYYVDNYKPYDKAGSYGVQQWLGLIGITKIVGSYYNVMGLPTEKLYTELLRFIQS